MAEVDLPRVLGLSVALGLLGFIELRSIGIAFLVLGLRSIWFGLNASIVPRS